jgi:anti-sigma factor RsiW
MNGEHVREELHDLQRGRLEPARAAEVRAHLAGCATCQSEEEAERLLDAALRERLPDARAPAALRRRVEALVLEPPPARSAPPKRVASRLRALVPAAAIAALALLCVGLLVERRTRADGDALARLGQEVVTDHLRLLVSAHPHDLESSATHEVKPWFEGRLDFAPVVPPDGGELRLLGGAVGYVLDRKAAVMSYALRRHRVTLLAFPTAGLAWPAPDGSAGGVPARTLSQHGFRVVLWRAGELGYALVCDASAADVDALAARMAPETVR